MAAVNPALKVSHLPKNPKFWPFSKIFDDPEVGTLSEVLQENTKGWV
jgi:hypothetical protein